jgi:selenocysteine lyase/cysteine desulfurase
MSINRRQFFASSAALGAAALNASTLEGVRSQFPGALDTVYLDAAAHMPLSKYTAAGVSKYNDFHMYGPGEGRGEFASQVQREIRPRFAKLINAKPSEIGLVMCTKAGEAAVVNGLRIQQRGGNLVTNDFHYAGSIHDYVGRKKAGMDVRIVRHRDWRIDFADMEKVVDSKTKLISITLVSNVTGWVEDAKRLSELAHAHGAYIYADIIQAVGAVPVDVKALGLDFAACSNYTWLQGVRGAGFLYVREELQGSAVHDLSYPGYVRFNYDPWVSAPGDGGEMPYRAPEDGRRYEPGNVNWAGFAGQHEALGRMLDWGVDNMYASVKPLSDKLRKELPSMGYRLLTPPDAKSLLTVIQVKNLNKTLGVLRKANIQVTSAGENRLRFSPAIYNNSSDIDRLLDALS